MAQAGVELQQLSPAGSWLAVLAVRGSSSFTSSLDGAGMNQDTQPGDFPRITRVIDMKIPLTWLIGGAFAFACVFAGMYFQLGQLREDMVELKVSAKVGNNQTATIQGEMAILRRSEEHTSELQ